MDRVGGGFRVRVVFRWEWSKGISPFVGNGILQRIYVILLVEFVGDEAVDVAMFLDAAYPGKHVFVASGRQRVSFVGFIVALSRLIMIRLFIDFFFFLFLFLFLHLLPLLPTIISTTTIANHSLYISSQHNDIPLPHNRPLPPTLHHRRRRTPPKSRSSSRPLAIDRSPPSSLPFNCRRRHFHNGNDVVAGHRGRGSRSLPRLAHRSGRIRRNEIRGSQIGHSLEQRRR
mmetsp:Transcript_8770/g.18105  ORF Transcript_8770/g.18105 Transcript_8770/m.18105 type:complete len:229 (+) Transcript_8770:473-1159(+)